MSARINEKRLNGLVLSSVECQCKSYDYALQRLTAINSNITDAIDYMASAECRSMNLQKMQKLRLALHDVLSEVILDSAELYEYYKERAKKEKTHDYED